ncbi:MULTISPECIES: hypothetical protein [unclassified Frankia]|uniref:hypothetical protein n=1 Tax=unclassified Frankia TaxID=2632575 RepID=UPI002AD36562|nr:MULTISPECIES: hypothetical protein [unclassified Frankia]
MPGDGHAGYGERAGERAGETEQRQRCHRAPVRLHVETLRRHATGPQASEFSGEDMRGWYLPHDVLGVEGEQVLPDHFTLHRTVATTV